MVWRYASKSQYLGSNARLTTPRMVNLAVSPGVKYKQSSMPFVQMENISHFLRACEIAPLNLPSHDRFLTVDLYDGKDPAQVLQCIAAFSRRAHAVNPANFPTPLGGKPKTTMSPQGTGSSNGPRSPGYTTNRGLSTPSDTPPAMAFNPLNKAAYSGRVSPTKSSLSRGGLATGGPVSSWSQKGDENKTAPAWNIHQYGYMGGASQGNLGVAFGARRQITSQGPEVPSLAEKEKRLREKLEQEKRDLEERQAHEQAEREAEAERRRQEEEQAEREEQRRWQEETRKQREEEEQNRREQDRLARERNAANAERQREAANAERARIDQEREELRQREADLAQQRSRQRTTSDARLNGQFLSQYQAETRSTSSNEAGAEAKRIADLERQLAELRESQSRAAETSAPAPCLPSRSQPPKPQQAQTSHEDDWNSSERDYLQQEWTNAQKDPEHYQSTHQTQSSRPLPNPTNYTPNQNRTDRYLTSNPAPAPPTSTTHRPTDYSSTTESDLETQRRLASQTKTKAGGWASSSLLQREMERERERQREWEDGQKETNQRTRDDAEGSRPGQSWDVHQYGYMGGDNQNRGGSGLGVGGARRQIIGPRPPP